MPTGGSSQSPQMNFRRACTDGHNEHTVFRLPSDFNDLVDAFNFTVSNKQDVTFADVGNGNGGNSRIST
jgi:hypothetical protein